MNKRFDGEKLRHLRIAKEWTTRYLADAIPVSEKAVRDWERGNYQPGGAKLDRLAKLLGLPDSSALLTEVEDPTHVEHRASARATVLAEMEESYEDVRELIDRARTEPHRYKLKVINWRLRQGVMKFRSILSGAWRTSASDRYGYLRYVFGEVLDFLEPSDCYCTLSNLNFWSKDAYFHDEFEQSNIAASRRSVTIERLVILNPIDLKQRREQLQALVPRLESLARLAQDGGGAESVAEALFVVASDYDETYRTMVPFALITSRHPSIRDALIVRPVGQPAGLDFTFTQRESVRYQRFRSVFEGARTGRVLTLAQMRRELDMQDLSPSENHD